MTASRTAIPKGLLQASLLAVLYVGLGKLSFHYTLSYETVTSSIFLPEGIALAFVLLFGKRVLPGVFVGQFLLAYGTGTSLPVTLMISAGNTFEAFVGLLVLQGLKFDVKMPTLRNYILFVGVVALVLQPISAGIGGFSLWVFGSVEATDIPRLLWYWWLANALGQILLTPSVLIVAARAAAERRTWWMETLKLTGVLALFCLVFSGMLLMWGGGGPIHGLSAFLLAFPALIAISLRFRFLGATLGSLVTAMMAQVFTTMGYGPFAVDSPQENLARLNMFLVSIALSAGFAGALLFELRKKEAELRKALDEVSKLQGILPICASCKKIRDEKGAWREVEEYVSGHSMVKFSHGLCKDCLERMYREELDNQPRRECD